MTVWENEEKVIRDLLRTKWTFQTRVCCKWITKQKTVYGNRDATKNQEMKAWGSDGQIVCLGNRVLGGWSTNEERRREMEDSLGKKEKRQREEEGSWTLLSVRIAELLNCPFFQAPQSQNLSRGKPRSHRRIWDDEREKTRDEQIAALNWLEENIVSLISPLLILNPNLGAINWRYTMSWEELKHILP